MDLIRKYFPALTADQFEKFSRLQDLYAICNEQINVISRKDILYLQERHILHSLAIAKFISFSDNSKVLDAGTGGGFPGIPLAIFFPQVKFHLVDSIGKKIKVVAQVAADLNLKNITTEKNRVEELREKYDFILSRAVAPMRQLFDWTNRMIIREKKNVIANGWILLKGGDLENEIRELGRSVQQVPVSDFFDEEYFKEKFIINFS